MLLDIFLVRISGGLRLTTSAHNAPKHPSQRSLPVILIFPLSLFTLSLPSSLLFNGGQLSLKNFSILSLLPLERRHSVLLRLNSLSQFSISLPLLLSLPELILYLHLLLDLSSSLPPPSPLPGINYALSLTA